MVGFFRKKTGADTAKRKPNGAVNNDDDDGDNDTYPPSGKFQGPMTINGEGTMDAGETDGTADIPQEYRDANGNFKIMPVPRHLGSLTRRRPPLAVIVGVSGAGKSRLAAALMGKEKSYRAEFRVGRKTTIPKVVLGEKVAVLDTPGLPDPIPGSSAEYYDATVDKLRHVGYVNAVIFVLNQERVTPTLIKNYGILYSSLNRLSCVKMFVCRREHSFVFRNISDQAVEEQETRQVVNSILEAAHLKSWTTKRFFMWTNGSGEEQDKQVKYIREQVKSSPRVDITPGDGLLLTTERATQKAQDEAETKAKEVETAGSRSSWRKVKKADTAAVVAAIQPVEGAKVPPWEGAAAVEPSGVEAMPTEAGASAKNSGCVVM